MRECYYDDLLLSQESAPAPALRSAGGTLDRRYLKQLYDNVHGTIYLDPMSLKFIDTEQFQRLRDLKQLGVACMVYPGAVHTRFEHSLGVYWLAGQSLQYLQTYQGAELDIDHFDVQTVKLAGLLHDIGHGPFSHMFEHKFLPRVITGSKWSHEQMSGKLVDYIVDQHHIDIDSECLKQVKMDLQNTPMTVQLGQGARIQLVNAIIETGNARATIKFGSLDFPAVVAKTVVVPANGVNTKRPAKRLHPFGALTSRTHLPAQRPAAEELQRRIFVF